MEFRRAEIKRVYRHIERVSDLDEIKTIFEAILNNDLVFSMRTTSIGRTLETCSVLLVKEDSVQIFSRTPMKLNLEPSFDDVEFVEVVCNREIVADDDDDGGRWARII